jgi:hypothetical protein
MPTPESAIKPRKGLQSEAATQFAAFFNARPGRSFRKNARVFPNGRTS